MTFYEKFNHNLTREVQIVWKISALNAIDRSIELLKNSCVCVDQRHENVKVKNQLLFMKITYKKHI